MNVNINMFASYEHSRVRTHAHTHSCMRARATSVLIIIRSEAHRSNHDLKSINRQGDTRTSLLINQSATGVINL